MNTCDNNTNRFRTQGEVIFAGVPLPLEAVSVVMCSDNKESYKIYLVCSASVKTPNNINSCNSNLDQANHNLDRKSGLKFARNQCLSNFTGESKVSLNALSNSGVAVSGGNNCFSKSAWHRAACSARRASVQNLRHKLGTPTVLARGFRAYGCGGVENGPIHGSDVSGQVANSVRTDGRARIVSIQTKPNFKTENFSRCKKTYGCGPRCIGRNRGRSEVTL